MMKRMEGIIDIQKKFGIGSGRAVGLTVCTVLLIDRSTTCSCVYSWPVSWY